SRSSGRPRRPGRTAHLPPASPALRTDGAGSPGPAATPRLIRPGPLSRLARSPPSRRRRPGRPERQVPPHRPVAPEAAGRAARRDPDRGEAYAQRMFTLGAVALLGVTVVAMLLADPLVTLYAPTIHGPDPHLAAEHNLMVVWAYLFIPQIFFYGMSSLIGAVL